MREGFSLPVGISVTASLAAGARQAVALVEQRQKGSEPKLGVTFRRSEG